MKYAKETAQKGIALAESGSIEGALEMFNKAIEISPDFPAGYNDRAQALRLLNRNDGKFC